MRDFIDRIQIDVHDILKDCVAEEQDRVAIGFAMGRAWSNLKRIIEDFEPIKHESEYHLTTLSLMGHALESIQKINPEYDDARIGYEIGYICRFLC
jgi:hypothetical protein